VDGRGQPTARALALRGGDVDDHHHDHRRSDDVHDEWWSDNVDDHRRSDHVDDEWRSDDDCRPDDLDCWRPDHG
jgi:hypothetical protein